MSARWRSAAVLLVGPVLAGGCQETTSEPTPALAIVCSALPAAGPAPLSVVFELEVAHAVGAIDVTVDYGDGSQGSDPAARHVYERPGSYAASITVSAGPQTARCSAPVAVAEGQPPPPPAENRWPEPSFRTTPAAVGSAITGRAPLTVLYNLCRSQDPDGDGLFFRMDLDGDGSWEHFGTTGANCSQQGTYAAGTRTATVCVTDGWCPSWPLCEDQARWRFHPYQCQSYEVTAAP
jgi:hypothetical protein